MIAIQEIDIYSDNNIKVSAHIIVPNSNTASAEVIIYDPNCNNLYSSYQTVGQFTKPDDAYKAIIIASNKYNVKSGGVINRINNPLNTEFVNKNRQQQIIAELSINVTIEVNT